MFISASIYSRFVILYKGEHRVSMMYEGSSGRFFHVSTGVGFDEIIEIDIEKKKGTVRQRTEGKYKIPELTEDIQRNVLELLRSLIHPEDSKRYMEFWQFSSMVQRILESPSKMITEEFRQKKTDGTWGWVRQNMTLAKAEDGRDIVLCYVMDVNEEKQDEVVFYDIEDEKTIDLLTGLPQGKFFFQNIDEFMQNNSIEGYAMIAVDIEHFKLYNDWYGWNQGNAYLMDIATRLNGVATVLGGFAGYFGGDNFAIFIKHRPEFIDHMVKEIDDYINKIGNMAGFLPNLGLYFVNDKEHLVASAMYDRAVLALNEIRGKYTKRYNIYDTAMMEEIDREMSVLSEVQVGIQKKEFVIYFQPQVHVPTEKIVGAEVLVRWKNEEKGMISPGYFIPVLEKNGFITNLDLYIWEEVCAWQKSRMQRGKTLLPVSVNVSRVDAFSINLVETFIKLTEKYEIPRSCLKIEITESTYAEDNGKIGQIADDLRKEGFAVYLDDFGSGYSSLNMLKNIYVDALKIDMQFLDMNESNAKKGESIMESVINMARILRIPIIVEGAETEREIKSLTGMGCRYVQGYYYYKPMSLEEFEELLETKDVDYNGLQVKRVEPVHAKEFFDQNLFTDTMLNNIIGAVAFYDVCDDKIKLTRVNEQFYRVLRMEGMEFEEIRAYVKGEDFDQYQQILGKILEEAYHNPVTGAECNWSSKTPNGEEIKLHIRAFFLREAEGHRIFYVGYSDVGVNSFEII